MHPKRKKLIRGNNKPHINKFACKTIMKRSRLKNKTNKTKNHLDIRNYKKQRNIVVNLNKEAKLQISTTMTQQTQNLSGETVNHIFLTIIVRPILLLY